MLAEYNPQIKKCQSEESRFLISFSDVTQRARRFASPGLP
jgi:hypothetical protein